MEDYNITKANINGAEVNTVDARLLYSKLNVQSKFADWIKNRLQDFQENIDFIVSKNLETVNTGLKGKVDYILSLETAKHIAMIERNKYVPISKAITQGLAQYKTEIVEFKHKETQSFENIYYTNKLCECLLKSIQNKIQKEGVSQKYYIEQKQSTELRSRGV